MKKRVNVLLILAFALIVIFGLTVLFLSRDYLEALGWTNSEPMEEGRPLSYWIRALKDPNPEVRHKAAHALAGVGPEAEPAVPALAEALSDKEDLVRLNAAHALSRIGARARGAVPQLAMALKDKGPVVRLDAAMALRDIGPDAQPAVGALIEAFQSENNRQVLGGFGVSVRQQAAQALGQIGAGAKEAVPLLAKVVQDKNEKDEVLKQKAATALRKIDPKAAEKAGVRADSDTPK